MSQQPPPFVSYCGYQYTTADTTFKYIARRIYKSWRKQGVSRQLARRQIAAALLERETNGIG